MKLAVIIPVSPYEPLETVLNSVKRIKNLDFDGMDVRIVYVVDTFDSNDKRVKALESFGVDVLVRNNTRGKRAGAINDAISYLSDFNPEYVAIFDVDSKPSVDFVKSCVSALENDCKAYIASTKRYIYNPINLVSKAVWLEYYVINFLLKHSRFKQFNGLIGVLRYDLLAKHKLKEDCIAEDVDFATRMHCLGYRAILVENSKVFEQAPLTWRDLFNQRKRWYYGGLQLWRYFRDVIKSKNKGFIVSWISALTLTYVIILFLPLLLIAVPYLIYKLGFKEGMKGFIGLTLHTILLQISAICSVVTFLFGKSVDWKPLKRLETQKLNNISR